MTNKKIGIITWHYYPNFGSSLQAFALQDSISRLGYNVRFINYRNPRYSRVYESKELIRFAISISIGRIFHRFRYSHLNYMKRYLRQTKPVYDENGVEELSSHFDTIVFGSDQIWAPNVYHPIYQGKYSPSCKKVSYAASIGLPEIPKDLVEKYKENLSSFCHISVREKEGQTMLKEQCRIDSEVVLDPTLLLTVDRYKAMERKAPNINEPFVFCYFLNAKNQYRQSVETYAKKHGFRIVGCSAKKEDEAWMTIIKDISACEFLWLIHHSSCVFTDSYHGTIFSLLYHKSFRTFMRFAEDDPIVQNSRIRQLDQYFNIASLIQNPEQDVSEIDFDFENFESALAQLRENSLTFLRDALNE